MAALIQTIAVVDKSGKAISTSRHLVNVFKEAKAAYRERKAEVIADRQHEMGERRASNGLKAASNHDSRPAGGSRKHSRSHHSSHKSSADHRHSGSSIRSESRTIYPSSHNRFSQEHSSPTPAISQTRHLSRRHSARDEDFGLAHPPALLSRSMTSPPSMSSAIDMDLAYGPIPPPLPVARKADEAELKGLVNKVKCLLEEADCLQYSVSTTIASLQKNPDAMAAVALSLAEISNIATKMAPGVLSAMKSSAPAVFALLASPQFLIAGGVAVGVTVVALGGYKIIKRIRANNAVEDPVMDEMIEFGGDIHSIDNWRRGIAEAQEQSVGTSVDGEFITPQAFALSRLDLNADAASGTRETEVKGSSRRTHGSEKASTTRSKASSRTSSKKSSKKSSEDRNAKKVKKPSPLRLMFH